MRCRHSRRLFIKRSESEGDMLFKRRHPRVTQMALLMFTYLLLTLPAGAETTTYEKGINSMDSEKPTLAGQYDPDNLLAKTARGEISIEK